MPTQVVLTQTLTDGQASALVSGVTVTRPGLLKLSFPLELNDMVSIRICASGRALSHNQGENVQPFGRLVIVDICYS